MGQHRDLKINYDYLCEINSIVKKYIDALEELQSETEAFVEKINNQEGDVFVELKNEYENAIAVDYTDLIDILKEIYHVSGRYIEEMQYYIAPENSSMLCRVDRNDIWWNLQQIKAIPYAYVEAYPHVPSHYYMDEFVNPFADDADEVRARNEDRRRRRENNYNKLVDFYNNTIRSTADGLWQDTEDLKSIYDNYVVEYENTDDIYARKMDELYDSIKTWIDIAGDLWQGTKDLLRGFGTGIVDLVKGLKAPLEIMLAINPSTPLPLGVKIALLYDGGMEIYQGTKVFIKDPENTIGAMFQGMFDTGDEEGTAFCVGYATEKVVEVIVAKKVADAMAGPKVDVEVPKTYPKTTLETLKNTENFTDSALEHIFEGQINRRGNAVGYHYEGIEDTAGKVIPNTEIQLNDFGVYKAKVEVNGILKNGNGGYSTLFPKDMNPQVVIDAINEAYKCKIHIEGTRNTYIGIANNGLEIEMFIDKAGKVISAFPMEE